MEEQKKEKYKYGIWYERATGRDVTDEVIKLFATKEKPEQKLTGVCFTSLKQHDVVDGYVVPRDKTATQAPLIVHDAFAFAQTHDLTAPGLKTPEILKKQQTQEEEDIQRQIDETIRMFSNHRRPTEASAHTYSTEEKNRQIQPRSTHTPRLTAPAPTITVDSTAPAGQVPTSQHGKRRRTDRYTPEQKKQIYQNARNKSHTKPKQSQKRLKDVIKQFSHEILVGGVAMVLAVLIMLSSQKAIDFIEDKYNSHVVEQSMSQLLVPPNAIRTPSIVERHTHPTADYQNHWYDNLGIAEDILALPDVAFDAYMYEVYEEMGINRKNDYIDNWSLVISSVGSIAQPDTNPLAYARTHGCLTFEDYLIKNGWIDNQGLPSVELFKEHGQNAVNMYKEYLQMIVDIRNNPAETDDTLVIGGR